MTDTTLHPIDPIRPRQRLRPTGDAALTQPIPRAAAGGQRETIFDAR